MRANQSIRVSGVSNNAHLDCLFSHGIDGGTLSLENFSVGCEEISAFHSWASWSGTNKHANIGILEAHSRVSGGDNVLHAGIGAILKLHDETLENLLRGWKLNKLHDYLRVRSKHSSLSNEVAKEGANLTCGTGDGDTDGGLLLIEGHGGEVTAEGLKSAHEDVIIHFVVLDCLFVCLF